ncbi:MAG: aldo/keto reductase [Marinilabiliales bacterium]|nr:aldo/keto reductase [Marinilabiliales bacterium]
MEYIRLGKSGLKVSRICLGTMTYGGPTERWPWALSEEESRPFIQKALEFGINFFDTADMYSYGASEEVLGNALRDMAKRDEVVIATKVFHPMSQLPNDGGLSRKHIMQSIDNSLRRLKTDYVDLYQIHRWDYETPIEETMEALHDVVKAGKARYIGASSMHCWQFVKAQYTADLHGWTRFVSMQPHYNLLYREEEREMIPFCLDQQIGILPWSPLARGLLCGNRTRTSEETLRAKTDEFGKKLYHLESDFAIVDRLSEMAKRKDISAASLAMAWVLSRPGITAPIVGASKPGHLEEAVAARQIRLTEAERSELETLYQPHSVLGHV